MHWTIAVNVKEQAEMRRNQAQLELAQVRYLDVLIGE